MGVGPELVIQTPFRPYPKFFLALEPFARNQRGNRRPQEIGNDANRSFHQRQRQVGMRTVVAAIDQPRFGREVKLPTRALYQARRQRIKR